MSLVVSLAIGGGLCAALDEGVGDPAARVSAVAMTPALLVAVVPGAAALWFGRLAVRLGRPDARVPVRVGPGDLVPLHRVGCSPDELRAYHELGLVEPRRVVRLRAAGWSAAYLAAIAPFVEPSRFCTTVADVEVLPHLELTVDGAFGPLRLAVTDGLLEAVGPEVADDLQDESAMAVLGRNAEPSPVLRLTRKWPQRMGADWNAIAAVLAASGAGGVGDDGDTLRLRRLRAVLDAPRTRHDGHLPALPHLGAPPPCSACIERREFVRARAEAFRTETQCADGAPQPADHGLAA